MKDETKHAPKSDVEDAPKADAKPAPNADMKDEAASGQKGRRQTREARDLNLTIYSDDTYNTRIRGVHSARAH